MADEEVTSSIQMVLVDPEGNEHIYEPVLTLGVRGKDYIVLEPVMEGGEAELQIMGFHAGPNDELILDDIEDDDLYAEIAGEAEAILNGDAETEEYLIDDGTMSEEERAEINQEMYDAEVAAAEDEYCYEDENGNLFIYDENGKIVYLNEYGEPIEDQN
ncbi:MAG: DUF1292 domain-containing protein [Lachnospiraceae bacterium]|nr:DUF1292 domain-containing protein [Lachnospiraceae bacterium]